MTVEYTKLREKIFKSVQPILSKGTPKYEDHEITEAIEVFFKIIRKKVHPFLNGLSSYLEPALNNAFIEDIGQVNSLGTIADRLEAYLKKIVIICKGKSYANLERKNLVALFKELDLNSALSNQRTPTDYPALEISNMESFKGKEEYLYNLCYTRTTRNTVHDAPDWDEIQVLTRRNHILTIYIYSTLKYITQLKAATDSANPEVNDKNSEQSMLYDFITFSKTTTSIREQIISSFILHFLNKNGETEIEQLVSESNDFFDQNVSKETYNRLIEKLRIEKKVEKDKANSKFKLTSTETARIEKTQQDFAQNKEAFLTSFQEVTTKYGVEGEFDKLFDSTKKFFECNYEVDLYEALDKGVDLEKDDNDLTKEYFDYLKSITNNDEDTAQLLFLDILNVCDSNDFLLRLSASQIFTDLTNSRDFQHYVNQTRRVVFLDTQIILYALLYEIEEELNTNYENLYFKIIEELILFSKANKTIELNFAPSYIGEVSHHLKRALALIPYDTIVDNEVKLSNNVFYEYFWWMKSKEIVEKEYSFAEYMEDYFKLYETDIYDDNFRGIVNSNIYDFLKRIDINIPEIPRYSQNDIDNATNILISSIRKNNSKPKYGLVLKNDALMACHLSNKRIHLIEPVFLTWDKGFTAFRKEYVEKFSRTEILVWHLFNPAKFLNHISLLKMKINPQAVTNEFLSIMDSLTFREQVGTIYDVQSKFIELSSSDGSIARKNIKILKEIFETEFENVIDNKDELQNYLLKDVANALDDVISKLLDYLQKEENDLSLNDYRKIMKESNLFEDFSKIVLTEIKDDYGSSGEGVKLDNLIKFISEKKKKAV
ncbi:MAG: hypothetical protein MRY78_02040 [Saprospiraceae bacterium]|nr:hypothetical protein [Saprospiraceae bacterium]